MQEKPARASHTDLQPNRKNADYTVLYDGFTVRFASPHPGKRTDQRILSTNNNPVLREKYLEAKR